MREIASIVNIIRMLIGIGIDEHTVKCCELWDCEKEKKDEDIE